MAGVGEVVVIDVGGATTDVHSHRSLEASSPGIEEELLPPPATLRTVEGDLGMRAGAEGAFAVDGAWICSRSGLDEPAIRHAVSMRGQDPGWIPATPEEAELDGLLGVACATQAVWRHCGTMLLTRSPGGPPTLRREGADLREVGLVIGTGGVFSHRDDGERLLGETLGRRAPRSLAPEEPQLRIDSDYLLAAAGVLASLDPNAAWRLLERNLLVSDN